MPKRYLTSKLSGEEKKSFLIFVNSTGCCKMVRLLSQIVFIVGFRLETVHLHSDTFVR